MLRDEEEIIDARDLVRIYRSTSGLLHMKRVETLAVNHISFSVKGRELFGMLGPNGAGKTTTINMLTTLLIPTSGNAVVLGYDVAEHPVEVRRRIGLVLGGERGLYYRISGRQNLRYFAFIFGVDFSSANLLSLSLVIIITAFSMTGFGLMLSSFGLYLRTSMVLANIFLFAELLFCGVNFPISYLPEGLRVFSYIFPMTYGTDAARAAVAGSSVGEIGVLLLAQLFVGSMAILLGYIWMKLFEYIARSKGTLERS